MDGWKTIKGRLTGSPVRSVHLEEDGALALRVVLAGGGVLQVLVLHKWRKARRERQKKEGGRSYANKKISRWAKAQPMMSRIAGEYVARGVEHTCALEQKRSTAVFTDKCEVECEIQKNRRASKEERKENTLDDVETGRTKTGDGASKIRRYNKRRHFILRNKEGERRTWWFV